jgi:hypothetical protein
MAMQTQYQPGYDADQSSYDAEQPLDDVELDVEEAFGEHNIEYWVRKGNKLVPATEDEVAQIHEWERESSARARLALWKRAEVRPWPTRQPHGAPYRAAMWLRQRFGQPRPLEDASREKEQRQHPPVQPQTASGHDEHGNETAM